ncbi:uncharacterized protein cubi_03514 [Cryptosporidium ubiquitum]|uniref:U4/U6.U5 small nuclear ribonucleoprotein 27kDa protein domain-containing protein n=1 Tax=Cryptosporidium ubiquitum TaxID=857276 RepID=A0A1J4ML18_9CRYT|nr:uncharacterized protein cubi_03514 [Cryptosporidium ubiquitum]OII73716.1 hypothetical protein cubi_03514 [Cryptosporidium ubiquitum]
MYTSHISEEKHSKKKVAPKREATKKMNILNRKSGAGMKKSDSFKFNASKYDDFGRVSKHHTANCQKKSEARDLIIGEDEKKDLKQENIAGSEKYKVENISSLSESEIIKEMFGIEKFETSKNKNHSKSSLSCSNIKSRRKYRQYMNRPGGFNRPLSPIQ